MNTAANLTYRMRIQVAPKLAKPVLIIPAYIDYARFRTRIKWRQASRDVTCTRSRMRSGSRVPPGFTLARSYERTRSSRILNRANDSWLFRHRVAVSVAVVRAWASIDGREVRLGCSRMSRSERILTNFGTDRAVSVLCSDAMTNTSPDLRIVIVVRFIVVKWLYFDNIYSSITF